MITKFDSLYAGHVDLENIGYGGTPINDRRYDNDHLSTALSQGARRWRRRWTALATTRSGWRSTISSARAPSASPTCC